MKNIISIFTLLFITLSFSLKAQDDTLLIINDKAISVGEFTRIFEKNNQTTNNLVDKQSISVEEYLDLFINFKLKVTEAEFLKMDTLHQFIRELKSYRHQLEKPYFTDTTVNEKLIKEAFERQQWDIDASHILIMVAEDAAPKDTLIAYNKIKNIRDLIVKQKNDFNKIARTKSEDPSAKQNQGHLGYFTVFQMVYPFENAAYNTPIGNVSNIVRTRYGYHIVKVHNKRKAQGIVKVAHIMVGLTKKPDSTEIAAAQKKINLIYSKIQNGEDFGKLAETYSDDKSSSRSQGILPEFGTGRMVAAFEKAAFALKKEGEISKPIQTSFGFHILKLVRKKNFDNFKQNKKSIAGKVKRDMRARTSFLAVLNRLKKEYKYTVNQKNLDIYSRLISSDIFTGKWDTTKIAKLNAPLFTIGDSTFSQTLFSQYLIKKSKSKKDVEPINIYVTKLFNNYVNEEIKKIETINLPNKYPEFRYLLQEYHDGILLFDLTDKKVWSKAVNDTSGLEKFYKENKENYKWGYRIEADIYQTKNASLMSELKKMLQKATKKGWTKEYILLKLNKKDSSNVELIASKMYKKGDYALTDDANKVLHQFEKTIETPQTFTKDNQLVYIHKSIIPTYKKLNEARGKIIADYQDELEKLWVKQLRKKFKVEIRQNVWKKTKNKHN